MSREEVRTPGVYYTIIDGTFRTQVPADSEGAIRRDWTSKDGKTSGTKYERHVSALIGKITGIGFFDGDHGQQLVISLDAGDDGRTPRIALQVESREAEGLMQHLPSVDLTKDVKFRPFNFTDDNGKQVRGIQLLQEDESGEFKKKVENFFKDPETRENRNGFPAPDDEDTSGYSKDQWKRYFLDCRIFLVDYTKTNFATKFAPPAGPAPIMTDAEIAAAYGDDLNPADIPF